MPNWLLVGAGGCGCRLLDAVNGEAGGGGLGLSRLKRSISGGGPSFSSLAVDVDRSALEDMDRTLARDRLHVDGSVGSPREGREVLREHEDEVLEAIRERGEVDVSIVMVGGGGHTGSSFAPLLADWLSEETGSVVYLLFVLPFSSEVGPSARAVEALREAKGSAATSIILVDNSYLASGEGRREYGRINGRVAEVLYRLMSSLEKTMVAVADLGDLKSTLRGGDKLGTLGFIEGSKAPIDEAIRRSVGRESTLFPVDVYNEGARALFLMEGAEEVFETGRLQRELGNLSTQLYNVFKGIIVDGSDLDVVSVVSLDRSRRLQDFVSAASSASAADLREVEER